jgi:hypothetical protein
VKAVDKRPIISAPARMRTDDRGLGFMQQYHLYYLRNGQLVGADHIEAVDDQEAERIAKERGDGRLVEVWNGHSRLRVIDPVRRQSAIERGGAAPGSTRHS